MPHGMDVQRAAGFFREANAIVADPQAQFAFLIPELSDIALAGFSETMKSGEDSHGCVAVKPANVEPRMFRPAYWSHVQAFEATSFGSIPRSAISCSLV